MGGRSENIWINYLKKRLAFDYMVILYIGRLESWMNIPFIEENLNEILMLIFLKIKTKIAFFGCKNRILLRLLSAKLIMKTF
jgi:hypothetical protein